MRRLYRLQLRSFVRCRHLLDCDQLMRKQIIIYILSFISLSGFSQTLLSELTLTDQLSTLDLDFLTITIKHGQERYKRNEINTIYHEDGRFKIHSLVISTIQSEHIDTSFVLNETQKKIIDKFGRDFNNNHIQSDKIVVAGNSTIFSITINDSIRTLYNKWNGFSLVEHLLYLVEK